MRPRSVVLSRSQGEVRSDEVASRGEGFFESGIPARRVASRWVRRLPPMRRRAGRAVGPREIVQAGGADQTGVLGLLRSPEHGEQPDHGRGGEDEQLSSGRAETLVNPLQRRAPPTSQKSSSPA